MKNIRIAIVQSIPLALLALAATPALAGQPPISIPEPGIMSLLALGGAVMVAIGIRNRRKNKK